MTHPVQVARHSTGGRVRRDRPLAFTFDGRRLVGFEGDTLASALVANGVRVVGRSFKYHRPRGLLAAGQEEPNALVQLETGALTEPNLRATEIELYDGLSARAVNCWPSAAFDIGAVNRLVARFIPAGFYYKSFFWPRWEAFEPFIRRAAGLGRAPSAADPHRYELCHAHCDILVVGAGPAGLAAAAAAASTGVRVLLAEQDHEAGGALLWEAGDVDGAPGAAWAKATAARLAGLSDVRILARTRAIGYYDHNLVALVEHLPGAPAGAVRQRLHQVRARQVVLATGAIERPIVFPGNDRPGVMLASAVRQFARRYAARAGNRAVVFTNNDSGYATIDALRAVGADVALVVDARAAPSAALVADADARQVPVAAGSVVVDTSGTPGLTGVKVRRADGRIERHACDLLAMSGGWNPAVHLFSQSGGTLRFDAAQLAFVPLEACQAVVSAGAANGAASLREALDEGHAAGLRAAAAVGRPAGNPPAPAAAPAPAGPIEACWAVGDVRDPSRAFVDFQNDVTLADIALSARENYVSVEHLKRYTTLGMAPDQGKTANVNALALMGELTGRTPGEVGTTRYRPPFTPTALGVLAANSSRERFRPVRRGPLHAWHARAGAVFEDYGSWLRPSHYAAASFDAAVRQEALAVRSHAGLFDASTLGKIEVRGPDAATFLDRVYANRMSTLDVGRLRYGLMLNELGALIDDGVVARLADDRFLVGTTSGAALRIARWLEEWLQCEWPDLRVVTMPVTSAIAVPTLAGPAARSILAQLGTDIDLSPEAFPHMTFRTGHIAGVPVRIARASYTGELSYELNVEAEHAEHLWRSLHDAGTAAGLRPVGLEAWMLLRLEKGFLHIGADTDGTTLPDDVGWGHVLKRADDFIGRRSLTLPANRAPGRHQLVGLTPASGRTALRPGQNLQGAGGVASDGYITSAMPSAALGRSVALAMVRDGRSRLGEWLHTDNGERVQVAPLVAYDPDGERLRG